MAGTNISHRQRGNSRRSLPHRIRMEPVDLAATSSQLSGNEGNPYKTCRILVRSPRRESSTFAFSSRGKCRQCLVSVSTILEGNAQGIVDPRVTRGPPGWPWCLRGGSDEEEAAAGSLVTRAQGSCTALEVRNMTTHRTHLVLLSLFTRYLAFESGRLIGSTREQFQRSFALVYLLW